MTTARAMAEAESRGLPELDAAVGLAPYRPAFFSRRRRTGQSARPTWASSLRWRAIVAGGDGRGTSFHLDGGRDGGYGSCQFVWPSYRPASSLFHAALQPW